MSYSLMNISSSSSSSSPFSSFKSKAVSSPSNPTSIQLPLRPIPGSHGWPLLGPLSDRLDYFWFQGPETFFRKRMEKNKSSVFRTNLPPAFPFFGNVNPNVIAVLDVNSFAHLFDMDVVQKDGVLVGDFMPSVKFTGNMKVGVYRDTTDPKHTQVKKFSMDVLKRSSKVWVKELVSNLDDMFDTIESTLTTKDTSSFVFPLQKCIFNFLTTCMVGANPVLTSPEIANSGYAMLDKWLGVQLIPTQSIGVLQPLEEIFLHTFAYPFALVSSDYNKLVEFIRQNGQKVLQRGETEFGLTQDETLHNLLFVLGFNAFGGFSIFLLSLLGNIITDKSGLQEKLRAEVREKFGSRSVSDLSFDSIKDMELVQSFVYETLRFEPPVPLQFARARKDFRLSSHDSEFDVKKGELLCGFQKLVMRDPNVFDEPEIFKSDRFVGEGKELLSYLYWSNGPQTGTPSTSNKQCSAKDTVTLTGFLVVAYLFIRYDKISGESTSISTFEKAK